MLRVLIFFIAIAALLGTASFATKELVSVNSKFTDAGEDSSALQKVRGHTSNQLGKLHLSVLHFPIVLVLLALVTEMISILSEDNFWKRSTNYLVALSLFFSLLASYLGWLRAGDLHTTDDAAIRNLFYHKNSAFGLSIGLVLTFIISELNRRKILKSFLLKRIMLLACSVMVAVVGYFGGLFVFGGTYFQ